MMRVFGVLTLIIVTSSLAQGAVFGRIREAARRRQAQENMDQVQQAVNPPANNTSFRMALDNAKVGSLPEGWTAAKTGEGPGSVWSVVEDATAPHGKKALAQTSAKGTKRFFNLCVADKTSFTDLDLTVSLKAIAGVEDQGGGPVWRYKDANNYYVARVNPLEHNYRVYHVVNGKRTQLATADVDAPTAKWHTLRVVQTGNHIQCFLNGKLELDVRDDTMKEAGKIGLWSKADAQTHFADLQAKATK